MRATESSDGSDPGAGFSILLLEDNLADAKLVTRRLRGVYEVMRVTKLSEAFEETGPFAAILLDLGLPDADGLEAVAALRTRFAEAAIVVLTGLDDDRIAHEAVREGAQDYLVKDDVSSASLVRSIRYAIERKTSEVLRNRLYHSDRLASVGQLAAGVAHEINNPSSFLLNNAEHGISLVSELTQSVRSTEMPDEASRAKMLARLQDLREMFADNLEGIRRIQSVVGELSSFSRMEEGDIELLQLNDLITVACNLTRNEVRHHAETRVLLGELPTFPGHRGRITQVLVNLIINAAHAIESVPRDQHTISLISRFDEGTEEVVMEVHDTGCGIAPESQSRIFEPFFTTKAAHRGTGLGLSLCSDMVRRHGGRIDVQSQVGAGAVFSVHLPIHNDLVPHPVRSTSTRPHVRNKQALRILIIDDEAAVRRGLTRILRREHQVTECTEGQQALLILQEDPTFDVLICDLMMPGLDGVAFYAELKAKFPVLTKRIIFLSGGAVTERARNFVLEEKVLLLSKPVSTDELEAAISRIAPPDALNHTLS